MTTSKLLQLLIVVISLASCKQDDAPVNPCDLQQSTSAAFVLEELVGERYFEGDTVTQLSHVRFRALQKADEYMWILGAETLRTQSFVRTNFPHGWLDVSLKVKKTPNTLCFPYDDGIDSCGRLFYVWGQELFGPNEPPHYPYYPIYGTYRGYNQSNPSLLFNVTIFDTFWVDEIQRPAYVGLINGIPYKTSQWNRNNRNNASFEYHCKAVSPKAFNISVGGYGSWGDVPLIPRVEAYGYLNRANPKQITIEYAYSDTLPLGTQEIKYSDVFVGWRLY